ncbi:hypothetical protein [Rhizohabitans arisaemae]|uniref:hypothetical protein n=1 Tax=Rhizohabitans arisaemae TaxID=2720610 RepID=UPI0024B10019|nr:hypothetical protein [Rhizohabitans arisaemae]
MRRRPMTLTAAAVVLALEGLTSVVLGGYVAVQTVIGKPEDVTSSIALAVFGLGAGAALLWVAKGLLDALRWSRSPAIVTQIFALPVSISLIQAGAYLWGVPLVLVAVAGLVAMFSPPTTNALIDDGADHSGRG